MSASTRLCGQYNQLYVYRLEDGFTRRVSVNPLADYRYPHEKRRSAKCSGTGMPPRTFAHGSKAGSRFQRARIDGKRPPNGHTVIEAAGSPD